MSPLPVIFSQTVKRGELAGRTDGVRWLLHCKSVVTRSVAVAARLWHPQSRICRNDNDDFTVMMSCVYVRVAAICSTDHVRWRSFFSKDWWLKTRVYFSTEAARTQHASVAQRYPHDHIVIIENVCSLLVWSAALTIDRLCSGTDHSGAVATVYRPLQWPFSRTFFSVFV